MNTEDSSTFEKKKRRKKRRSVGADVNIVKTDIKSAKKRRHYRRRRIKPVMPTAVNEVKRKEFVFILTGANDDGSRIYCRLKRRNHNPVLKRNTFRTVIEGFYDFDMEKFIVTREHSRCFAMRYAGEQVFTREEIYGVLKEELLEFDWSFDGVQDLRN